jgi:SAM-dependent methyltransferase
MLNGGKPERLFAQHLAEVLRDAGDILDVGTSQRFAKELRPYEAWFADKRYVAAGYQPSQTHGAYNCDCHQDIQAMTFADESFDAVLCIEVVEHVADPFAAARELLRVLRPGGQLLLTTPFLSQFHGKGNGAHSPTHESYPDYWRFTHQGLERLCSGFRDVRVFPLGGPIEFRLAQFYLSRQMALRPLRALVDFVDRPRLGKATGRHLLTATK